MKKNLKIVYMGTPDFAVEPLEYLLKKGYDINAVVTAPDKPSGRGLKLNESPVKKFALQNNLRILQPENLKSPEFIDELKNINPDLQIVVAFRMLPQEVWKLPRLGTFNLHASLLPQYRGAAPINWAIINGENITGVTTFFINESIDTGNIIMSEEVSILPDETAGELHDKLMYAGAMLVLKTVKTIENTEEKNIQTLSQQSLIENIKEIKPAPKIFKDDCFINWNNTTEKVYNLIRGLSPYPTAYTKLLSPEGNAYILKVFRCTKEIISHSFKPSQIITDGKSYMNIATTNGQILLEEIQLESKKKMSVKEFLRGFQINNSWKIITE